MLQTAIKYASCISAVFFISLLNLINVCGFIFNLTDSISLILDELTLVHELCCESHFTSANSLIVDPFAVVDVTV